MGWGLGHRPGASPGTLWAAGTVASTAGRCLAGDPTQPLLPLPLPSHSGPRARVHWRFLPDSYAEWVPTKAAPSSVSEQLAEPRGGGPWRVSLRWALDSEHHNE